MRNPYDLLIADLGFETQTLANFAARVNGEFVDLGVNISRKAIMDYKTVVELANAIPFGGIAAEIVQCSRGAGRTRVPSKRGAGRTFSVTGNAQSGLSAAAATLDTSTSARTPMTFRMTPPNLFFHSSRPPSGMIG